MLPIAQHTDTVGDIGTVQMSADIDNKAAGFMLDQPFDEVI